MEETISIQGIFKTLKKRWKMIVILTVMSGLAGGLFTYYVLTPRFEASTQILVNQKNSDSLIDSTQLRNNVDLINTYSVIIKSPIILEKVIKELNLNQSVRALNQQISVSSQENSLVFSLTVEDVQPDQAVIIANTISEIFQREISNIMNVDNVSILARAELENNPSPIYPIPIFNISIALMIGLMGGVALTLLREYLDNTLKDSDDVQEFLELPVLGAIQKLPQKQASKSTNVYKREGESLETSR